MGTKKIHVTGTSFRKENFEKFLAADEDSCHLALVPERDNPKDSNAVKVMWHDLHIGYVGRKDAEEMSRLNRTKGFGFKVVAEHVHFKRGNAGLWIEVASYKI